MVIYVRGTKISRNSSYALTALLSGEGSVKYNRKTLILPFDFDRDIEQYFIGKLLKETEVDDYSFSFDDDGVDALFRRVDSQRLLKEHFDACCQPVFDTKNLLDIPRKTGKASFIDEILNKPEDVISLINFAKDVYDDIYMLSKGYDTRLLELLNSIADVSIACIKQTNKEEVPVPHENLVYIINEYDKNSVFNVNYMAKMYNTKRMIAMPYDAEFRDSYNLGNLVTFLGKNQRISTDDTNFPLMSACDGFLEKLYNEVTIEINDEEITEEVEEQEYVEDGINIVPLGYEPEANIVQGRKGQRLEMDSPSFEDVRRSKKRKEVEEDDEEEFTDYPEEDSYEDEDNDDNQIEDSLASLTGKRGKTKKKKSLFGSKKKKKEPEYDEYEEEVDNESYDEDENYDDGSDYDENAEYDDNAIYNEEYEESEYDDNGEEEYYEEEEEEVYVPPTKKSRQTSSEKSSSRSRRRRNKRAEDTSDYSDDSEYDDAPTEKKSRSRRRRNRNDDEDDANVTTVMLPSNGKRSKKTWRCPVCGCLNENSFCKECGTQKPVADKKWKCTHCKHVNPAGTKYCEECGKKREV